jgi:hypothetical protein
MIIKSEFTIDITASDFISGDIYRANNISELKPIILIIHGFKVHNFFHISVITLLSMEQ